MDSLAEGSRSIAAAAAGRKTRRQLTRARRRSRKAKTQGLQHCDLLDHAWIPWPKALARSPPRPAGQEDQATAHLATADITHSEE